MASFITVLHTSALPNIAIGICLQAPGNQGFCRITTQNSGPGIPGGSFWRPSFGDLGEVSGGNENGRSWCVGQGWPILTCPRIACGLWRMWLPMVICSCPWGYGETCDCGMMRATCRVAIAQCRWHSCRKGSPRLSTCSLSLSLSLSLRQLLTLCLRTSSDATASTLWTNTQPSVQRSLDIHKLFCSPPPKV